MRIHTSLTRQQMMDALKASGAPIFFESLAVLGSRTHARAFEVALSGSGGKPQGYSRGKDDRDYQTATWDEWGAFLGALYDLDVNARSGGSVKRPVYRDAEHFHFSTGSRFVNVVKWDSRLEIYRPNYLPADTHPRHRWEYEGSWGDHGNAGFHCTKCSAIRPSWEQIEAYAPRAYK